MTFGDQSGNTRGEGGNRPPLNADPGGQPYPPGSPSRSFNPEPSPLNTWGPRIGLAVCALVAVYVVSGWLSSALDYERVGPQPSAGGKVLVLLHGAGAAGDDLVGLAEEVFAQAPQATILVPEGPHRAYGGRVWVPNFSVPTREEYTVRLTKEIEHTNTLLWDVIKEAREEGALCSDIYIGGFSQGGRMAAEVALRAPADCTLGGVIVMSGGGFKGMDLPSAEERPAMRVLVAHGTRDNRVGIRNGQATAAHFTQGEHEVWWLEFEGKHTIAGVVREAIPAFIKEEEVGEELE